MSQCNHGNKINTNFLCGQENVWKSWGLRACSADWVLHIQYTSLMTTRMCMKCCPILWNVRKCLTKVLETTEHVGNLNLVQCECLPNLVTSHKIEGFIPTQLIMHDAWWLHHYTMITWSWSWYQVIPLLFNLAAKLLNINYSHAMIANRIPIYKL